MFIPFGHKTNRSRPESTLLSCHIPEGLLASKKVLCSVDLFGGTYSVNGLLYVQFKVPDMCHTGMRRIMTFRSTTDLIYDTGPIRLL